MPRISPLRQLNRDALTPFAQIVYDYLIGHYVLVSELAEASGVSNNAIWSWLKHGILPRRQTIVQLAERVLLADDSPAFDLDELLTAAGLPNTRDMQRERLKYLDMLRASIDEVMARIAADPTYTASDREAIERFLRTKPDEFILATNTWREWRHESPMDWQMQQSEQHAAVYEPEPITTPEEAHRQPRPKRRPSDHPQSHRTTSG